MNAEPKPRRFRFSLRTLFVLVTIACVGFGWLGLKMRAKHREREAVRAIEELGGLVEYDYQLDSSGRYIQDASPPVPAWLRKLLGDDFLADVVSVIIQLEQIRDVDLYHLREVSQLNHLQLWSSQITDAGILQLQSLNQLDFLDLSNTQVTDAGLIHLAGLNRLKTLSLTRTRVTDAGLVHLQGLNRLEHLSLDGTHVSGTGLVHLQRLSNLKSLWLVGLPVAESAVEQLEKAQPGLEIHW